MFNLWSQNSAEAKNILKPDLGLRLWNDLTKDEKNRIWEYLNLYFFEKNKLIYDYGGNNHEISNDKKIYYDFFAPNVREKRKRISLTIVAINKYYKAKNYAKNYLFQGNHFSACLDFHLIFTDAEGDAVLELISFYCKFLLLEKEGGRFREKLVEESEKKFNEEKVRWEYEEFDAFAKDLNEVFADFGLNVYLTRSGFIPRQDNKINKEIFEPVLQSLTDAKWKEVNILLTDAFTKFRENTPSGYSSCVTHTVAAVEAFLQIKVKGRTGEGDFAGLVSEGQREKLIPSDVFTKDMFKTIISVLMRERKETGDAHVKQSYATEKNAKMVLNLAMVFIQHCIAN